MSITLAEKVRSFGAEILKHDDKHIYFLEFSQFAVGILIHRF